VQSRPQIDQLMRRSDRRSAGGPATTVLPPCPSPVQKADLRLVIHDYSGHPGQVHLSRELARRGHHVEHQYCASYTTGRGATRRCEGDPESFGVRAIELGSEFARYSPVARLRQELQYARMSARAILAARPDVAVLSNIPLLSLFILTLLLRTRRVPYVFWQQDIYSEAIRVIARDRFGQLGWLIGWVAGRVERQVARGAAAVVAISDTVIEQLDGWGVQKSKVHVVPNWGAVDEMPLRPRDNAWAKAHGLVGMPVVMYAGTLGLKHDPSVISRLSQTAPTGSHTVVLPPDNAVAHMVEAAEAGLVVAPGDADAASAALRNLLSSTAARDRMGTAARRYAERTFDVGRVGERFESSLCDIKKGRQGEDLASRTRTRDLTDTHRLTAET
jgi:glycosyltransferase involved in cell wall biosynthesis